MANTQIGRVPGLLRLGIIIGFDPNFLQVDVYIGALKEYNAIRSDYTNIVQAQLPVSYFSPVGGMFIGGYPDSGTPVIVQQADAGQWFIVGFLAKDPVARNALRPTVPTLEPGAVLLQANDHTFLKLSQFDGIILGETSNALTLDTNRNIFTNTFDSIYKFTEASRDINGIIKRDVFPNANYASSLRETALDYDDTIQNIGFDPFFKENISNIGSSIRNPPRTEKREVIFEYAKSFNILSDDKELQSYRDGKNISISDILNRRETRADVLSLSLVSPNHLMETIKGTVVDIYGNILDINRSSLQLGKTDKTSLKNVKTNTNEQDPLGNIYKNIKDLDRRAIAFHFEINSKKDIIAPPDISDQSDYARLRSRFFIDIDKEGLVKLNIPASSERGNIPLLSRYENFSTVHPNEKSKDPNDTVFNTDSQDILLESFIGDNGVIQLVDELGGNAAPIDRFSTDENPIYLKHGTVYHDISKTCDPFNTSVFERIPLTFMGRNLVATKTNIVTPKIVVSGPNAKAGGRSLSANIDGSIELNIGANTIDRHSLWLDTAGAVIGNFGRDCNGNNISAALRFDGEVIIESGGSTIDTDSRFTDKNNGHIAGAVDIRVYNQAKGLTIIRIDNSGINIHSESRINMYANGDINISSTGAVRIDGEDVQINGRKVAKDRGHNYI